MSAIVKCPYCKTIFKTTINTCTTCRNRDCKATLHIDNDGKVRKSELPRKNSK